MNILDSFLSEKLNFTHRNRSGNMLPDELPEIQLQTTLEFGEKSINMVSRINGYEVLNLPIADINQSQMKAIGDKLDKILAFNKSQLDIFMQKEREAKQKG